MDFSLPQEAATTPATSSSSSSSNQSAAGAAKSSAEITAWCNRVKAIQMEKATPEVRLRIQQNSERQQQAKYAAKKCHKIEKVNYLTSASNISALSTWKEASSAPAPMQADLYQQQAQMQSAQTNKLQGIMKSSMAKKAPASAPSASFFTFGKSAQAVAEEEANEFDEEEDALNDLEREVQQTSAQMIPSSALMLQTTVVAGGEPVASTTASALNTDMLALLEQLATEPSNQTELEAKFKLFENFLGTVTAVRETTIEFWDENKNVFLEGAMRNAAERQVRQIDSHDAYSIEEDPRKWFVYSMLKKANENSASISQVLASLRARLDMLAQAPGECPICLEMIHTDKCTILSCAHKVCSDCWDHYSSMMARDHHQLVCPLCRHEEFVTQLATSN
jgi:hypothetical protein